MEFNPCEICGSDQWSPAYRGPIRDGAFGSLKEGGEVNLCEDCGVERLAEALCLGDEAYSSTEYRSKLKQGLDSQDYLRTHDSLQSHTLRVAKSLPLQNAVIADVGCAGGSLLDHLRSNTAEQIAVEPCDIYHDRLKAQGYHVSSGLDQAVDEWEEGVDIAFSIHVVEHVHNPVSFLEKIRALLIPGGRLVLATPNRLDLLLEWMPEVYGAFFYRVVHRWYFDAASLSNCAQRAGWEIEDVRPVQRYGMANALLWLRDRKPSGDAELPAIDVEEDEWWKGLLEANGRAECLYLILKNPSR